MQASEHFPGLDLDKIAKLWNQRSVVQSWQAAGADRHWPWSRTPGLEKLKPWVDDSGEGEWTVEESFATGPGAGDSRSA